MEIKNWSIHLEFAVLFVTLLTGFYLIEGKNDRQSQRTDRLYEMFIDVQKEIKDLTVKVYVSEEKNNKKDYGFVPF